MDYILLAFCLAIAYFSFKVGREMREAWEEAGRILEEEDKKQ